VYGCNIGITGQNFASSVQVDQMAEDPFIMSHFLAKFPFSPSQLKANKIFLSFVAWNSNKSK